MLETLNFVLEWTEGPPRYRAFLPHPGHASGSAPVSLTDSEASLGHQTSQSLWGQDALCCFCLSGSSVLFDFSSSPSNTSSFQGVDSWQVDFLEIIGALHTSSQESKEAEVRAPRQLVESLGM